MVVTCEADWERDCDEEVIRMVGPPRAHAPLTRDVIVDILCQHHNAIPINPSLAASSPVLHILAHYTRIEGKQSELLHSRSQRHQCRCQNVLVGKERGNDEVQRTFPVLTGSLEVEEDAGLKRRAAGQEDREAFAAVEKKNTLTDDVV